MKPHDIPKILHGRIPSSANAPERKTSLSSETKFSLKCLHEHFENNSEMDAVIRVSTFVMQAVNGLDVTVRLQPSIENHPVFTDFYFVFSNENKPLSFIEVKNSSLSCILGSQSLQVAQCLREAHILTARLTTTIPFILTNSFHWSFGLASRKGSKIEIQEHFYILIDLSKPNDDMERLMDAIKMTIQGVWPLQAMVEQHVEEN